MIHVLLKDLALPIRLMYEKFLAREECCRWGKFSAA
jgi:hypothetical protein